MKIGFEAVENVTAMLQRAPNLTLTYVKQEMVRFGARFRKKMVSERMSGSPGINAPKLSKGKNIAAWTTGDSLSSLVTTSKITRILVAHEQGAVITPKQGEYLFIRDKAGNIVARVRQVTLPARLGFRDLWRGTLPEEKQRIKAALQRALKVASEKNVKQIIKSA